VHGEGLLGAAVVNNALWCDAVCRSHGYPGAFGARLWISARHDLEFYPNAISLRPDVTAAEAVAARELPGRYVVKDSFARLDLAAEGLTLLFEAEWIVCRPGPAGAGDPGLSWDTVTDVGELRVWELAWAQSDSADRPLFRPELLADPRCAILACRREDTLAAGVITYAAGEVTGISNLFGAGLRPGSCGPAPCRRLPHAGRTCPSSATSTAPTWHLPSRPDARPSARSASGRRIPRHDGMSDQPADVSGRGTARGRHGGPGRLIAGMACGYAANRREPVLHWPGIAPGSCRLGCGTGPVFPLSLHDHGSARRRQGSR
jgi:hypothetical protein